VGEQLANSTGMGRIEMTIETIERMIIPRTFNFIFAGMIPPANWPPATAGIDIKPENKQQLGTRV
jgi:hypothetical protein